MIHALSPDPATFLFLAAAAFAGGVIDAISGGGGLIAIPALLASGIDPVSAIATSKLQSIFGSGGALRTFARMGHVDFRRFGIAAACSFAGALGGSLLLQRFTPAVLALLVPPLLIAVACFFAATDLGDRRPATAARPVLLRAATFAIGAYDGFFGPGAGTFFVMAALSLGGSGLVGAMAHAKYFNVASNLAALAIFVRSGHVLWAPGLVMAAACLLGGQFGTHMATRFRARIAKPLLILMSLAFAVKLMAANLGRVPFQ